MIASWETEKRKFIPALKPHLNYVFRALNSLFCVLTQLSTSQLGAFGADSNTHLRVITSSTLRETKTFKKKYKNLKWKSAHRMPTAMCEKN